MEKRFGEVVFVLRDLLRIRSSYFGEDGIIGFIEHWFNNNSISALITEYCEDSALEIRGKNIVGVMDGCKPGPMIHLFGHTDTDQLHGSWTKNPFEGDVESGNIYGLGALDMKSGCAAIMVALKHFLTDNRTFAGRIAVSFVSDEKGPYGVGTDAVINDGIASGTTVALTTEPSSAFSGSPFPCVCLGVDAVAEDEAYSAPFITTRNFVYVNKFFDSIKRVTGKEATVKYFTGTGSNNHIGIKHNSPCLIFGVEGGNLYSADEYVTIDSLIKTTAVLYDYLSVLLCE